MKTYKQFISEADMLNKVTPSVESIAKKHKKTVEYIQQQLDHGIKIEKEHTSSVKVATEIALDHLNERPDYYIRLTKVD